jgi:hypothetical protein
MVRRVGFEPTTLGLKVLVAAIINKNLTYSI